MKPRKIAIMALLTAMIFLPALVGPAPVEAAPAWEGPYNGSDHDVAKALVVNANGVTYMCGDTIVDGQSDILIQKRNPDGTVPEDGTCTYDCPGHNPDHVEAAATDSDGAVFAVGFTYLESSSKWRIVKCQYGAVQWSGAYSGDAYDAAEDVAIDYNTTPNSVYVAGWSENLEDDTRDLVIQKYSADSNQPVQPFGTRRASDYPVCPVCFGTEKPVHVAVDDSGNAYLAGTVYVETYKDCRWILKKYDPNGNSPWEVIYGAPNSPPDFGEEMELRDMIVASGYAYLTGKKTVKDAVQMVTQKTDLSTRGGWSAVATLSDRDADVTGTNVAVDSSGNVYVLGRYLEPVNITTSLLVKYDASGEQLWLKTFTTSSSGNQSLAVDGAGTPVVTAQSYPDDHIVTRWFNPANGDISHEETCSGHGYPAAIGVDGSNNVYITGSGRLDKVWPSAPDQDIRTLKYTAP